MMTEHDEICDKIHVDSFVDELKTVSKQIFHDLVDMRGFLFSRIQYNARNTSSVYVFTDPETDLKLYLDSSTQDHAIENGYWDILWDDTLTSVDERRKILLWQQ